jgi:tetratricopeptide (TPR) repeat protein
VPVDLEDKTGIWDKVASVDNRVLACFALLTAPAFAQAPVSSSTTASAGSAEKAAPIERGVDLASKGRCEEALPLLQKLTPAVKDKQMKYRAMIATVRCAMNRGENQTTANALFDLKREYPEDPEVLYMTSQFFLGVAESASQELATLAPNSYQTHELEAETLESQGKWADATEIYKQILEEHPKLRGIHYRLGRAALSQPELPTADEAARKEFEQELAIDPVNAAAEYWLGDIAAREGKWEEAIPHFASAAKLNANFADALLALGTTFNSAGRFAEAIQPLEQYVRRSPQALAGHYQLYIAYARTGRQKDAVREMTLHQQLTEKQQALADSKTNAAQH